MFNNLSNLSGNINDDSFLDYHMFVRNKLWYRLLVVFLLILL